GEGGILALTALATSGLELHRGAHRVAMTLGLIGASLLFADGIITPAISVLSAVEGLAVASPALERFVPAIAVVILVGLFSVQRRGTGGIGAVFGPVMLLWFAALGALGVYRLLGHPSVLVALSPLHAVQFLTRSGRAGFLVLGSVFLVVTGGEALYADLGHFGAGPVRRAWFAVAMPALLLQYFGQGALLLEHPDAVSDLFFRMAPPGLLYPMIALSTAATVIASQALISGAYSLTSQALMLGYLPRFRIDHTSARQIGQIYVPAVNWVLMVAAVLLVLGFGSSSRLAAAYGLAVTVDMGITTLLAYVVARRRWGWSLGLAGALTLLFLGPEGIFLFSNLAKIPDGGWFPIAVGVVVFTLFTTWHRGREILADRFRERVVPLEDFFELLRVERPARVPGSAVYMTSASSGTPPALLLNFEHNRAVHERVVLLTIQTEKVARVAQRDRLEVVALEEGFRRVIARYGFMEKPDVPKLLLEEGLSDYSLDYTTFFLGKETVLPTERPGMALWRERIFAFLTRNAHSATTFYGIPPARVVEMGSQIEL
ncbi:MAG: KUP/HAK/KT family potassium transporter, partial [Deltaproteobacteria bacterium]|nr:KUP/HAK/KT family potassium transporter [Deltaproteobacteria bacterium]